MSLRCARSMTHRSTERLQSAGCGQEIYHVRNPYPQLGCIGLLFAIRAISDCLLIVVTIQLQHPLLVAACLCAAMELAYRYAAGKRLESL